MPLLKTPKVYPEANPFDNRVKAARWVLTAEQRRQELYNYLRALTNEKGQPLDVSARVAEEICNYTNQYVHQREGFSLEEVRHINAEIKGIYDLRLKAYPFLH